MFATQIQPGIKSEAGAYKGQLNLLHRDRQTIVSPNSHWLCHQSLYQIKKIPWDLNNRFGSGWHPPFALPQQTQTPHCKCFLSTSGDEYCLPQHPSPHLLWKEPLLADTLSIVCNTLWPGLWPDQLRQGLGSQIASAASGIIGLMGVTDASVTTASFRLPICPFRPSRVVRTPGVFRIRDNAEGWGRPSFNSAVFHAHLYGIKPNS